MPRLSMKQYQQRVLIAMAVYTLFMVFVWPQVTAAGSLPLKLALALAPTVPVIYVIAQLARLIRDSDELERHTHLVALSTATAVVSVLTFIVGFLAAAGVLRVDGSALLLVFPAVEVCYALVRWWVVRGYGGSLACEGGIGKPYLYLLLFGVAFLVLGVVLRGLAGADRAAFLYGLGGTLCLWSLLALAVRWYRRRPGPQ